MSLLYKTIRYSKYLMYESEYNLNEELITKINKFPFYDLVKKLHAVAPDKNILFSIQTNKKKLFIECINEENYDLAKYFITDEIKNNFVLEDNIKIKISTLLFFQEHNIKICINQLIVHIFYQSNFAVYCYIIDKYVHLAEMQFSISLENQKYSLNSIFSDHLHIYHSLIKHSLHAETNLNENKITKMILSSSWFPFYSKSCDLLKILNTNYGFDLNYNDGELLTQAIFSLNEEMIDYLYQENVSLTNLYNIKTNPIIDLLKKYDIDQKSYIFLINQYRFKDLNTEYFND